MTSSSVTAFCKQPDCPTAESLVAYCAGFASPADVEQIARHLDECEFCGAELQMLLRCPITEERCRTAQRHNEVRPSLKVLFEELIAAQIRAKDLRGGR